MVWDALAERILAGSTRKQEIDVEKQSEYEQWRSELDSKIKVFVKRVDGLDLEESEDRAQLYDLIDTLSSRVQTLTERSETSSAPTEVLIELDKLVELLEDTSAPIRVGTVSLRNDPFKQARQKKQREEREQERIEKAHEQLDEIADQIQEVFQGFDDKEE
jgi:hypothetical protein